MEAATLKAIELAMLGLADEAVSISNTVDGHTSNLQRNHAIALAYFYAESGHTNPSSTGALDEEALKQVDEEAISQIPDLPEGVDLSNVTQESYTALKSHAEQEEKLDRADATTGYHMHDFDHLRHYPSFTHQIGNESFCCIGWSSKHGNRAWS